MSASSGPDIITNGLVLHLDVTNRKSYPGSGNVWLDRSGYGNNFTLLNTPTFEDSQADGLRLNPTQKEYATLNISSISSLKVENFLGNSHTMSIWVNLSTQSPTATDATEVIQGLIVWPGYHNGLTMSATEILWALYQASNTSVLFLSIPFTAPINQWFNISVTALKSVPDTLITFYINGVYVNSAYRTFTSYTTSSVGLPANTLNIGAARDNNQYNWLLNNGKIGNVVLYNRALAASEILQNYNATKSRFGL